MSPIGYLILSFMAGSVAGFLVLLELLLEIRQRLIEFENRGIEK